MVAHPAVVSAVSDALTRKRRARHSILTLASVMDRRPLLLILMLVEDDINALTQYLQTLHPPQEGSHA